MTTPITYTTETATPSTPRYKKRPPRAQDDLFKRRFACRGTAVDHTHWRTGRPGRLCQTKSYKHKESDLGKPAKHDTDRLQCSECLLKALDRCFTRQPQQLELCTVDVCDHHRTHKEPVMAKTSEQDREVRPNEITPPQYHTSWSPSSLSIRVLVDVLKSLWLVERHHADIHASEQRILHIILQTTEVLGSIKETCPQQLRWCDRGHRVRDT